MAVSLDVLNSTLQDLKGPLLMSFNEKTPLFRWLEKTGRTSSEKGTWIQRMLMGGSPSQMIGLYNGGETFDTTRTEQVKIIKVGTHRFGGAIAIPGLDLETNNGSLGAIKLIKEYPASVIAAMSASWESAATRAGSRSPRSATSGINACARSSGKLFTVSRAATTCATSGWERGIHPT